MHNTSIWIREKTTYVVTDLVACYDRQLPNYESLVLKLVRVDRNIAVLIIKVLLVF